MKIDARSCICCGECAIICPVQAIQEDKFDHVFCVDEQLCVECGLCRQQAVCPVDAIALTCESFDYPRLVRSLFSNPSAKHLLTGVPGRGTEEVKTNDVTNRTSKGHLTLCLEFGRPGIGCTLAEIEPMAVMLMGYGDGVVVEPKNPLGVLLDREGHFPVALKNERVLSAILEVHVPLTLLETIIRAVLHQSENLQTVFSLCIAGCFDADGGLSFVTLLEQLGLEPSRNAKVNLGLGRE